MDAFDKYVTLRFQGRDKKSAENLSGEKKEFYQSRAAELLDALGFEKVPDVGNDFDKSLKNIKIQMITIRTAFDEHSTLLKPVATFPKERLEQAELIAHQKKPQEFEGHEDALAGIKYKYVPDESGEKKNGSNESELRFSAIYDEKTDCSNLAQQPLPEVSFVCRIEKTLSAIRKKASGVIPEPVECFFSVSAKPSECNKGMFTTERIIAIYCEKFPDLARIPENLESAHKICSQIFSEIDQIQKIDNQLFELEGHELVSSLQPTFLDNNIAPADKIAFAIEKLKKLLKKHLESHYPASENNQVEPEVYFVTLAYEALKQKEIYKYRPTLQVYPHVYRKKYAIPSFHISHPEHLSVSKRLLKEYFDWHEHPSNEQKHRFILGPSALLKSDPDVAVLDDGFKIKLFKDFDKQYKKDSSLSTKGLCIDYSPEHDRIFVSLAEDAEEKGKKLYEKLNVAVKGKDKKNNSILAYVIEGREFEHKQDGKSTVFRQLPRAILAIEGQREELFSEDEQNSLRVVATAFSNLVRHIFHDNSLLEYRIQLSGAYRRFAANARKKQQENLRRFLLVSMAVDVQLLGDIREGVASKKELSQAIETIFKDVFTGTGIEDEETSSEVAREKIRERFRKALAYVEKSMQSQVNYPINSEIVDFLEACPRNFSWAGYAPSLTQALGDRADFHPPTFDLMTPGYSASGMYMAVVRSEIRQVAKLASLDKLRKEHKNYRNFVRYKVLLAARMAANGLAFDSTGALGQTQGIGRAEKFKPGSDYPKECYGVLVSDLTSSLKLGAKGGGFSEKAPVSTLQELAWKVVKKDGALTFNNIANAIRKLFGDNLGHWYHAQQASSNDEDNFTDIMIKTFRLDYSGPAGNEEAGFMGFKIEETFESLLKEMTGSNPYPEVNTQKIALDSKEIYQFVTLGYQESVDYLTFQDEREIEKFKSVVHADLNSRNLVWAGPIDHFMMIDFEHTSVGFWGMDQARLAVNLIVDHMAAIEETDWKRRKPTLKENSKSEIEATGSANMIVDGMAAIEETDRKRREPTLKKNLKSEIEAIGSAASHIVNEFNRTEFEKNNFSIDSKAEPSEENTNAQESKDDSKKPKDNSEIYHLKSNPERPKENIYVLTALVTEVLRTTVDFYIKLEVDGEEIRSIYRNSLAMALVKEYEYSLKNIKKAALSKEQFTEIISICTNKGGSDHPNKGGCLCKWLTALFLSKEFDDTFDSREKLIAISRYVISYWILQKIFSGLDFNPDA